MQDSYERLANDAVNAIAACAGMCAAGFLAIGVDHEAGSRQISQGVDMLVAKASDLMGRLGDLNIQKMANDAAEEVLNGE